MLNGVLMAADEATVPATDRALTHGLGLYETLKLVGGVPVFFEEHIARLDLGPRGARPRAPLRARARWPRRSAGSPRPATCPDGACRVLVTAGPPDGTPGLLIQTDQRQFPARPLRVISYRGVRVRAQLKAMTVMQSYLAQRAATAAGADDAILVDDEGRIFEGATSNMFLVRGGGLVTPPAEGAILPGVLRAKVEELATAQRHPRRRGVRARRRPAPRRRHAAHEQRARHRAGRQRRRARAARATPTLLGTAARARRRGRGGERRRLPRPLPLAPALSPLSAGFTPRAGRGTTTP